MNVPIHRDGFDAFASRILGDLIKPVKGVCYRNGEPIGKDERHVAIMESMEVGSICWENGELADKQTQLLIESGIPEVLEGYAPYTSILLVDEFGALATFAASSWGGRNAITGLIGPYRMQGRRAFPIVTFGTKMRCNKYGTVDPALQIVGWAPKGQFTAITGDEPLQITGPGRDTPDPQDDETNF